MQTTFGLKKGTAPLKFKVFGIGGAGCNLVAETNFPSVAVGSNVQDLERCSRSSRLVMTHRELDSLSDSEPSALTPGVVPEKVCECLNGCRVVVLVAGLGGMTGSHGVSFFATASRLLGKTSIAVVSTPFSVEGSNRRSIASDSLNDLKRRTDLVICFENDRLKDLVPRMPIHKAFRVMNAIMERPIIDLSKVMGESDLQVLRQLSQRSSVFHLGVGLGRGRMRDSMALKEAFESPWFDFDLEAVNSAFAIVSSSPLDPREVDDVITGIHSRVPNARLMLGSYEDTSLGDRLRISIIAGRPKEDGG